VRKESLPFCASKDVDRNPAVERHSSSGIELVEDLEEALFLKEWHLNSFSYIKRWRASSCQLKDAERAGRYYWLNKKKKRQ